MVGNTSSAGGDDIFNGQGMSIYSYGYNRFRSAFTGERIFSDIENVKLTSLNLVYDNHGGVGKSFSPIDGRTSSIIDILDVNLLNAYVPPSSDQNGNARVSNSLMDIGAVEYQWAPTVGISFSEDYLAFWDTTCVGTNIPFQFTVLNNRSDVPVTAPYMLHFKNDIEEDSVSAPNSSFSKNTLGLTGVVKVWATSVNMEALAQDTLEIYVGSKPEVNVPDNLITDCFDEDLFIDLNVVNGTPGYNYFLSSSRVDGQPNYVSLKSDTVNLRAGLYDFKVVDAIGCEATVEFRVSQPERISIDGGASRLESVSCYGRSDGVVNYLAVGGTGPYSYKIVDDSSPSQDEPMFEGLPSGEYEIRVEDALGCFEQFPAFVEDGKREFTTWFYMGSPVCETGDPVLLSSQLASKGAFYVNEEQLVDDEFDPAAFGVGVHDVVFRTDVCEVELTHEVEVISFEPEVVVSSKDVFCITNLSESFEVLLNGELAVTQNSDFPIAIEWFVNDEQKDLSKNTALSGDLDFEEGESILKVKVTLPDLCSAGIDQEVSLVTITSEPKSVRVFPIAPVVNDGLIIKVVANDTTEIPVLNLDVLDSFYSFKFEVPNSANESNWSISSSQSLNYDASGVSLEVDTVIVTVSESECGTEWDEVIIVQPINTAPFFDVAQFEVLQETILAVNLKDFIHDKEHNIISYSVNGDGSSLSGVKIDFDSETGDLKLDYSEVPNFKGEDIIKIRVCDVESCVLMVVNVNVEPYFYVEDIIESGVQGSVRAVLFDSKITDAEDFTITIIDGPFKMSDVEAVVDTLNKTLTLDWGNDPDFVGSDYITYQVCTEGRCKTGKLSIEVKRVSVYLEETGKGGIKIEVFNALSPNGDEMNDSFEYEFILPNGSHVSLVSHLMIFNRWGDIVYENKSYYEDPNERFVGVDKGSGDQLLDGTYFFTINFSYDGIKATEKGYLQLKK